MTAPLERVHEQDVPAVSTAGNDDDTVVTQAQYAGTVTKVEYIPEATITGAATNNRTVSLVNKGQDGSGSTTVASQTFGNGVNATGNNENAVPLSGTPANLVVAAGDTLLWRSVHVGTGITDPGGLVRVTIARS
jgi:hypothetical protein